MAYNYRSFPLDMEADVFRSFWEVAPQVGDRAPMGSLFTLDGRPVALKSVFKRGPVVMEFGSFS